LVPGSEHESPVIGPGPFQDCLGSGLCTWQIINGDTLDSNCPSIDCA